MGRSPTSTCQWRSAMLSCAPSKTTARSSCGTQPSPLTRRTPISARWHVDVSQGACARAVRADHAVDVQPRRTGRDLHRPRQSRQQSVVLRNDRRDQSLRRTGLPAYGCCLGSINLTKFVNDPFGEQASFDFDKFRDVSEVSTRARQRARCDAVAAAGADEAANKRRIGLGFTGLGNTLTMLGLRYDSDAGRNMAAEISRTMRDAAYQASAELARRKARSRCSTRMVSWRRLIALHAYLSS